jgi:CheY-like chemotaxis protein
MLPLVMCIDDDSIVQMLSEIILLENNFCEKIVPALDGKEGLNYFLIQKLLPATTQKIPPLIFLDINMPIMDGWDFLAAFNEECIQFHQQVKVIILSSSENPQDMKKAKENPFVIDFIPKPLEAYHLNKLKSTNWLQKHF